MEKSIKGFKGFGADWKCNGYQFAPNTEHKHTGPVEACSSGFHFCEHPLDVFAYYPPAGNKFAEVEGSGELDKHSGDSKLSCSTLKIGAEISLSAYIQGAVKFVFDRAKWSKEPSASATGERGAASATGTWGAASATGTWGAASATGERGAASATGGESCAIAIGIDGKAKGVIGAFLTVAEWKNTDKWHRVAVKSVRVDGKKIKAETWYSLKGGKFVEVK